MRQVNCYVPIKVCITGRLSDAQLDVLGESLVRALVARIAFAEQRISSRHHGQPRNGAAEIIKQGYKAAQHDVVTEKYNVPSYQGQGAITGVIVQRQPDSTAQASSGSLFDQAFEAADQSRWEVVAELINGLSPEHLRYFLGTFKGQPDKISYIYLGAIGNKRVGKDSAVALATRVTYLDFSFREQLKRKDWSRAAYFLNAFNRSDILLRLKSLNSEKVKAVHEGAIANSEVGEDSGAAKVSAEVLAQRLASGDTKALLLPTIRGDNKDALAKVMRVIDGISPSGNPERPFTMIVDGQPETLTAAQADEIRRKAAGILRDNLNRVRRKADDAENRYKAQNEVDKDHWIVAPIVQTLGRVKDPGPDLLAFVVRANRDIQSALEAASSGQLEKAATFMASAEGAAISASKMWQAYFEGIISAAEMTVTVLEITRDAAFLTLAVLATVATAGAAAGALGAGGGAAATTTVLGFEVGTATAANVIAIGAPVVANLAEAGAKVSMGDKVDWGALVVDTAVQIIIARFGGKVTGGISKALIGNPATASLAAKVTEKLVHTVILHVGSTALTTAAQDAYRALKGQNVTWQSFADDLIVRLTDPKGIAVVLVTTALTTAAATTAGRPSRAASKVEGATGASAEARVAATKSATASARVEARNAIRKKAPKGISEEEVEVAGEASRLGGADRPTPGRSPGGPSGRGPAGGGGRIPGGTGASLLQRQAGAALRTEAASLEQQIAALRSEAQELERNAAALKATRPDRAGRMQQGAAQRRRVADALIGDVEDLRRQAGEFESGSRSATANLPGPEDLDLLFAKARSETGVFRIPLARAERDPRLLPRLLRPLLQSRTGNRVVFRVEGGVGRQLIQLGENGSVTLTRGTTIHLNFGSYERAVEFLGKGRGRIVAFEVDEAWVQSARSAAIPEPGTGVLRGRQPRLVDIRFAEDQMEIPSSHIDELQQFIVPGSGRMVEVTP